MQRILFSKTDQRHENCLISAIINFCGCGAFFRLDGAETKTSGYSNKDMKLLRRLKLTLSCLLAVLLVGGTILPSPALWQCRHSSRLVSAAFADAPSAMPCLMDGSPMRGTMLYMPCCRFAKAAAHSSTQGKQAFSHPTCHPTLTSLAAVPAPGMARASLRFCRSLAAMQAVLPMTAAFGVSAPSTLCLRQRPPPTGGLALSAPSYSFGLRAPPIV